MENGNALPKNIRQIGEVLQDKRIYMEDYVMTYIRKRRTENGEGSSMELLLGKCERSGEMELLFVTGVIPLDDTWEEQRKKYFPEAEPVGCYVIGSLQEEALKETTDSILKDPFILFHFQDEEENLYWSDEQDCARLKGYFIFYERNPQMQKFIAECCEPRRVEEEGDSSDQAVIDFRKKVEEKRRSVRGGGVRYLAGSFLTLIILFLGVTIIHNYDKMKKMEETISQISEEQERERLQLAAKYAAAEAASLEVETEKERERETEKEAGIGTEMETEDRSVLTSLEEAGWNVRKPEAADEEGEIVKEDNEELPEPEAEDAAAASGSGLTISDMEISRAVQALEERSYSAEQAPEIEQEIEGLSRLGLQSSYTVKYGDTLADISERYYGSLEKVGEICELNGIDDANLIVPGQKIMLP